MFRTITASSNDTLAQVAITSVRPAASTHREAPAGTSGRRPRHTQASQKQLMIRQAKRLILAFGAAAGLLALGTPMAAQASTHLSAVPRASVAPRSITNCTMPQVGQMNWCTAKSYALAAPWNGCYFSVGDRYEGSGGAAVGMAELDCPYAVTGRILVYLDYHNYANGQEYTYTENANGTPYYGSSVRTWTGCARNVAEYWTTYAKVSIDGSPYSGFFKSKDNQYYSAGPNCP